MGAPAGCRCLLPGDFARGRTARGQFTGLLPTTIWAERIGEPPDPIRSSPLEVLSLDSLPTTIWPEPADPVLVHNEISAVS